MSETGVGGTPLSGGGYVNTYKRTSAGGKQTYEDDTYLFLDTALEYGAIAGVSSRSSI
jgi:hypothetical protein